MGFFFFLFCFFFFSISILFPACQITTPPPPPLRMAASQWICNGYHRSGLEGWPENPTIRCHLLTANKSVLVPGMSITEREKSPQQWPKIMPRFCEPSQLQPKKRNRQRRRGDGLLRYKRTHHPLKLAPEPVCQPPLTYIRLLTPPCLFSLVLALSLPVFNGTNPDGAAKPG